MSTTSGAELRDASLEAMREALSAGGLKYELDSTSKGDVRWLTLSAGSDADFHWSFGFFASGERHIYALYLPQVELPAGYDGVIWYHPFEPEGYGGSQPDLEAAFSAEGSRLLRSHARVRRRRLLINWSVELECSGDGVEWERVYAFRELRSDWLGGVRYSESEYLTSPPLLRNHGAG